MATKHHLHNPLKLQFDAWLKTTADAIASDRGYAARAARALGVTRQTMSRWLRRSTPLPGWAAVALRQWIRQNPFRLARANAPQNHAPPGAALLGADTEQNRPSASQPDAAVHRPTTAINAEVRHTAENLPPVPPSSSLAKG